MTTTQAMIEATPLPAVVDYHSYVRAVNSYPVLSDKQERELVEDFRTNNTLAAAKALVCSHLRQVVAIARMYRGYGLPEMDLIQEGNIGLMKAVKNFDPERKVRLSTYATYWIKASLHDYIIRFWKIVKVATTSSQRKLFFNLRSINSKLGRRLSIADVDKISSDLSVPKKDVVEMEKRMTLMDVPFDPDLDRDDDEHDSSPSATYAADGGMHAELMVTEQSEQDMKLAALHEAVESLPERERIIIKARTLSESGKDTKLKELAEQLSITAERVRQLEKTALKKIEEHVLASCA